MVVKIALGKSKPNSKSGQRAASLTKEVERNVACDRTQQYLAGRQYTLSLTNMESRGFPINVVKADLSCIVQALDEGVFTSEQLVQEYISKSSF
jgi:hypothetical protein